MANTELVSFGNTVSDRPSNEAISNTKSANSTLQQTKTTSSVSKVAITGSSVIYKVLGTTELSNEIKETIVYNEMKIPMLQILHGTQKNGCLYNGICASIFMSLMILCSLSSVFMIEGYDKLLSYPLVTEFVKGIFNRHPAIPKYANIWDIYGGPSLSF